MAADHVLTLDEIRKSFGGVHILQGLSTAVDQGEKLALIGPNGAGKTTLLNIIGGQIPPTGGRVLFRGEDVSGLPAQKRANRGMARSFQVSRLFDDMTVEENLLIAFRGVRREKYGMLKSSRPERKLREEMEGILSLIGMEAKRDTKVWTLAYGEQRKLELGLALTMKPVLLLLDEPTAGLAIEDIPNFIHLIRGLAADLTCVFVAHDMDVVRELATRVLVLASGGWVADGPPEEIAKDKRVREVYLGTEDAEQLHSSAHDHTDLRGE